MTLQTQDEEPAPTNWNTNWNALSEMVRIKIESLASMCLAENIKVRGFARPNSQLEYLFALPPAFRLPVATAFINYVNACEMEVKNGSSIRDGDYRILWRILKQLGLKPMSQFFSDLTADHSVEVYNRDFIQVYRNIRFMELCSYSIEEIFTRPLKDLFHRDEKDDKVCFEAVSDIFKGNEGSPVQLALPPHLIYEKSSDEKRKFQVSDGFVAALQNSEKQVAGFVACLSANHLIEEDPS